MMTGNECCTIAIIILHLSLRLRWTKKPANHNKNYPTCRVKTVTRSTLDEKASEYDQEMPKSQTTDQPTAQRDFLPVFYNFLKVLLFSHSHHPGLFCSLMTISSPVSHAQQHHRTDNTFKIRNEPVNV